MFNLFRKNKSESNARRQYAPNTKIPFDDRLIDSLESEHKALLTVFTRIARAYELNNHQELRKQLLRFKDLLREHLLKENTQLYVYLKYVWKNDDSVHELIVDMQQEMGQIGKDVYAFLRKWTGPSATYYNAEFKQDLQNVGEILNRRITNEERNLYPIYREPGYFI